MEKKGEKAWPWGAVLAMCIVAAYGNSVNGQFIFDDIRSIVNNEALHDLSHPGRILSSYGNASRPVVAISFAIDYSLHGNNHKRYHVVNTAVHLAAALLLFGIVRRTLLSEKYRERFGAIASPLAFGVALLWGVHPLQTEAVTYIVQRAESMMGMFFLMSLYCAIRGAGSSSSRLWNVAAVVAAVCGAGCKQVIVVLPLIVLLYDRCFISGNFRAALKRAPALYAGLMVTWLIVPALLAMEPKVGSAGFGVRIWYEYAWSQFVIILHYIRLVFWPVGQCFDYLWPVERDWTRTVPCAAIVLALVGATFAQLRRNTALGFCGAWFFVILAPTSSIMPVGDMAAERRMYLPLAAIAVLVVFGAFALLKRFVAPATHPRVVATQFMLPIVFVVAILLGLLTAWRNVLYQSEVSMWEDVLTQRPENRRALLFLGSYQLQRGNLTHAAEYIDKAVEVDSNLPAASKFYEVPRMKGQLLLAQGNSKSANKAFHDALSLNPQDRRVWAGLYDAIVAENSGNSMIAAIAAALKKDPASIEHHFNMGTALAGAAKYADAEFEFNEVLKQDARHEGALYYKGKVRELSGDMAGATDNYRAVLQNNPNMVFAALSLAWIMATSPDARFRDGNAALELASKANELTQKKNPEVLDVLATAYAEAGDFEKAVATAEAALKALPANAPTREEIQARLQFFKEGKPFREKKK